MAKEIKYGADARKALESPLPYGVLRTIIDSAQSI